MTLKRQSLSEEVDKVTMLVAVDEILIELLEVEAVEQRIEYKVAEELVEKPAEELVTEIEEPLEDMIVDYVAVAGTAGELGIILENIVMAVLVTVIDMPLGG
ncbi:hypothetical protein K432DRAFT_392453 [Lepidopterella palustris CBS 459.81]|uniref:Uncharacterized protein n=1 Tax=Lepidopterella palustris CBS 459.81 TaxID=1314670 RepID=A0A8E2EBX4_9PEZI|nr:hypothetical protein K432DRAFT_392453 [Lepidopterella palustris CBS 459.81]